jgi:hypothetical protein
MGRWIVILIASAACCGAVYKYAPGMTSHAFYLGSFDVRWMMLVGLGFVYMGHRLTKKG